MMLLGQLLIGNGSLETDGIHANYLIYQVQQSSAILIKKIILIGLVVRNISSSLCG